MTPEQFQLAEQLFHGALERAPGPERDAFLRENCPADLLSAVAALIAADSDQAELTRQAAPPALPRLGAYQADAQIGSGGHGLVYRAHRADGQFEQTVAIKILRASAQTELARAQFLQERQTLAHLNHPNIARLLDGGLTEGGEPYLVMEYVEGQHVDDFCDDRKLAVGARLLLFGQVLEAVDYAHRTLILHRDLKPSNILVNLQGIVKIVDFGTSKFTDDEQTVSGARALTPRYASPEHLRGERATVAADIFSLGVVLFELLTGAQPFGKRDSMLATLERAITETDPTAPSGVVTEAMAEARATRLNTLRKLLAGDLTSILFKALAHDPRQRYSSVAAFSNDLDRYLNNLPVLARPQTLAYRGRKWIWRNRLAVAAVTLVILSLGTSAWYSQRQARLALREANRAFVARFAMDQLIITAMARSPNGNANMREFAGIAVKSLENPELDEQTRTDLLFSTAIFSAAAGDLPAAMARLREAAALAHKAQDRFGESLALARLSIYLSNSNPKEAEPAAREALRLATSIPGRARQVILGISLLGLLQSSFWGMGLPPDIDAIIREELSIATSEPLLRPGLPMIYDICAAIYGYQKRPAEEKNAFEQGLKVFREFPSWDQSSILERGRYILHRQGDYAGAERFGRERLEITEKTMGADHFWTMHPRILHAYTLTYLLRLEEAERELQKARLQFERAGPEREGLVWLLYVVSARTANFAGRGRDAEKWARIAGANRIGWNEKTDARIAEAHLELGIALRLQGRFTEAITDLDTSAAIYSNAGQGLAHRIEEVKDNLNLARLSDKRVLIPRPRQTD